MNQRPLAGRRVLVTRATEQVGELSARLTALGAEVVQAPMIEFVAPVDEIALERARARLADFQWVVLTSGNGVDAFVEKKEQTAAGRRPRVCAVGPVTATRLEQRGWTADLIADVHRGEGVVDALAAAGVGPGSDVLVVCGDLSRDVVPAGLRRLGADVTEVVAYRTQAVPLDPAVATSLARGQIDVIAFTSGSTVRHFVDAWTAHRLGPIPAGVAVACLGPVTADEARAHGLSVQVVAADTTVGALVAAIVSHSGTASDP